MVERVLNILGLFGPGASDLFLTTPNKFKPCDSMNWFGVVSNSPRTSLGYLLEQAVSINQLILSVVCFIEEW